VVKGLDLFRAHFDAFTDRYVLIGGTACDLAMNQAGLPFRATKDLDIVLCAESLDEIFGRAFWAFVQRGGYQLAETAEGRPRFYRFHKPSDTAYPAILELFSRVPDALPAVEGSRLTRVAIGDEVASLSAILLDADYYGWIQAGRRVVEGLPIVGPAHLVPLKARAWLDLRARKAAGEEIDSGAIKKHRNDVFRLFQVVDPEEDVKPPLRIVQDMRLFVEEVGTEDVDLKALGLRTVSRQTVLDGLRRLYRIGGGRSPATAP
jgi:hypothetical protein